ncbi:helix-turn-helix domain-containing protein [Salinicoccus sp. CNSTN-B1]
MKKLLVIDNLAQLKSVSDPFRIQLLTMLGEKPKTGQMLADELEIPRAKIHYHLNELLKNGISM